MDRGRLSISVPPRPCPIEESARQTAHSHRQPAGEGGWPAGPAAAAAQSPEATRPAAAAAQERQGAMPSRILVPSQARADVNAVASYALMIQPAEAIQEDFLHGVRAPQEAQPSAGPAAAGRAVSGEGPERYSVATSSSIGRSSPWMATPQVQESYLRTPPASAYLE